MTQNRQSQSYSRISDRDWNENPNRFIDQENRGQYGNYDEDFQSNTQSGSRRNQQHNSQGSNYRDSDSNSYGRNDYNSQNREWDNQFRPSGYGNQQGYRSERGFQERGMNEDTQRSDRGYDTTPGNYGQQYGRQQGLNYGLGSQGRNFNEGSSSGSTYGTGTNYGSGNMGNSNWGNGNSGSNSNWGSSNRGNDNDTMGRSGNLFGQHRGKGPKGYQRSDDRIKEEINDRLTDDSLIDASEIEVEVDNGVVSLAGSVDSRETKRRAEDLAESISGVSNVENRLSVNKENTNDRKNTSGSSTSSQNSSTNGSAESRNKRSGALAGAHS